MVVSELITHFVTAGLSLASTFLPILESVRAIADSVGASIATAVDPAGAGVDTVRAISRKTIARPLQRLGIVQERRCRSASSNSGTGTISNASS